MHDLRPDHRTRARDLGLARLRRATRFSIFGATALAGAFAGVAAHSNPGHKARAAVVPAAKPRAPKTAVQRQAPVTRSQPATAPAPAPAPPAPVTTTVAPVATTGAT